MASLLSVNVGMPKDVPWQGKTVYTGIWKESVTGPRMVRRLNIDGDGQGDRNGHGGEQRAVLVYQIDSYEYWQRHFGRDDFVFGQFGENFTVDGLSDDDVCIGDRYRIGAAEFEVTQPRVTCFRVGMRLGQPALPSLLVSHHRPGFYLRVITEGPVMAGDEIVKISSGPGQLSVADVDALLYLPDRDPAKVRVAAGIPALSPGWRESFREMLDGGAQPPVVGVEPGWTGFRRLRVHDVVPESDAVVSIYLRAEDGAALPVANAGQYLTVRIAGAGQPAPVRSYSLSSAPGSDTYRLSVKREVHGVVSGYLHANLRPGATVEAAAPRGDFILDDGTNPVLLMSAGIGVTPVLAMLHQLSAQRSQRAVWWIHITREPSQHVLAGEARELLSALEHGREYIFYTAGNAAAPALNGRPSVQALTELGIPSDATAYICGPAVFMTDMQEALGQLGLATARVHTELFGALPSINPGVVEQLRPPPHQPPGTIGTGPLISFVRSGLAVRWSPRFPSVLDLADACDVPTRWSCRTGVCHTCITTRLSGELTYDPEPLEPPGTDEVLICSAQPATDTVLDL